MHFLLQTPHVILPLNFSMFCFEGEEVQGVFQETNIHSHFSEMIKYTKEILRHESVIIFQPM